MSQSRAVHGHSAGAEVVLVGPGEDGVRLGATLRQVCTPARLEAVDTLRRLAELTAAADGPMVLADAGLAIELPATLDLLDVPDDRTAALLADPRNIEAPRQQWTGLDHATLARIGPGGVIESASTVGHSVSAPNRVVVGLLRISAEDRPAAAAIWQAAAELLSDNGAEVSDATTLSDLTLSDLTLSDLTLSDLTLFDLALLALVRGGVPIAGRGIGYFDWSRQGFGAAGIGRSPWQQRLRSASRLGDGAYSAAVVRPLSRLGTRLALAINLSPNLITMISIVIGLVAGLLIMTGRPAAWIVAAVLIQLALVIDCMDGEVARFTRRFSTFGAWLDGIGDRFKEYLIFAAVAVVATQDGSTIGWPLAAVAMVLITVRHLEDYAYSDRNAADRVSILRTRSLDEPGDGGDSSRTTLPAEPTANQKLIFWSKKVVHAPVAERTLIISLGLLTLQPMVVLIASVAVSVIALAWTIGGRFLRAVRSARTHGGTELDQQLDLGPLGARLARPLLTRSAAGEPARLDWLALPLVFAAEAAVIMVAGWTGLGPGWGPVVFLAVAGVVYRRYELIYGIRLFTVDGPRPLFGADGRILLTLLAWLIARLLSPTVLLIELVALAAVTAIEGAVGTASRRRTAAQPPSLGRRV